MRRYSRSVWFGAISVILVLLVWVASGQSLDDQGSAGGQKKLIPFSVTVGVPSGGASIESLSVETFRGVPLHRPGVVFPPGEDSFITQTVATPPDLQFNQRLRVEVWFSVGSFPLPSPPGTVVLNFVLRAVGEGGEITLAPVDQPVEASGGGLYRAVFGTTVDPVLAGSKLLTIQLGRQAEDNPQDTNPGEVRIEAVRISYTTRRPS